MPNRYHTSEYNKFVEEKLLWDGENMKITNFDEANQFVCRIVETRLDVIKHEKI